MITKDKKMPSLIPKMVDLVAMACSIISVENKKRIENGHYNKGGSTLPKQL